MNGMSSPKPPFRRQGSSVAGAHPMTVALTPQRVDYSVTKGGARTWAVLLVFMFLCSSLYTVFSAKEVAELGVDFDGDGDMDLDHEVDDDVDEVAAQQKHALKDTTPTNDDHGGHDKKNEMNVPKDEIKTADDDEAYVESSTLEEKLFAGLRAKMQKLKNFVKAKTGQHDEEEEEEQPAPQRRAMKRSRKVEKVKEPEEEAPKVEKNARGLKKPAKRWVEGEDEDHEQEEEMKKQEKQDPKKVQQLKWNPRTKREELIVTDQKKENDDDDDEDDDDDDDDKEVKKDADDDDDEEDDEQDDDDDDDDDEEEQEKPKHVEVKKPAPPPSPPPKVKEPEPEPEPEDDDDDDKKEKDVPDQEQISKFKRSRGVIEEPPRPRLKTAHITDDAPKRPCKRKNCPTDFGIEPRRGLLKSKITSSSGKRYQYYVEDEQQEPEEEENEEQEVDDEQDDEEEEAPIAEVIAIKKYRSTGREAYKRHAITNRDDHKHRHTLDRADHLVEKVRKHRRKREEL